MEKKAYVTPVADLLEFDYKETIVASGGRNVNKCLNKQAQKCGALTMPGPCYDDAGLLEASECM